MINRYIEHTNLKPTAKECDIFYLCNEAINYKFRGVCVYPHYSLVVNKHRSIDYKDLKISVVIGFPHGQQSTNIKLREAEIFYADELDVVINHMDFKDQRYAKILTELSEIVKMSKPVKVIVEECYYEEEELVTLWKIVRDSGAEYIKTSTGFAKSGATINTVKLWKRCGNDLKIKAAGGIRDYETALKFVETGADLIGTSHGVKIMKGEKDANTILH